ncbi:hypothetical protein K0G70_21240 [Bacteroides fragilis]|nr:hypothetical protein [Bacteroides fragilis]MCE9302727.1 hypothetical protein [Bacteroides fragilis]DAJ58523.1 MAG TPA: hypothetical protein [Caudoviricetes sp.]
MKTLIIYNSTDAPLQYAIVEGDYSDLNGICLNSFDEDTIKVEKACELLFDKGGRFLLPFSEDISLLNNKNWDVAIVITFIL